MIGGPDWDATEPETRAFVRLLVARGVTGGGWYLWPDIADAKWEALGRVPAPAWARD